MSNPRGRIHLMKAVSDGTLSITDPLVREHELSCLVCRSCETACPSGVQFSILMEHTREALANTGTHGAFHRFVYTKVIGSKPIANLSQFFLSVASKARIISLFKKTFEKPDGIFSSVRVLPDEIPFPQSRPSIYSTTEKKIGTVGLLIGCIGDVFTSSVNDATITVLNRLGYDVHTIPQINCCGALAAHAGYLDHAKTLGQETLRQIERSGVDYFISNIAGCGAMMKDYPSILGDAVRPTVSKIKDLSEFLFEYHYHDLKNLRLRFGEKTTIAYQAPCHLYHGQKIVDLPAKLLSLIENAKVTLLDENDICCGSAGTYNIERPEMAEALLARKMEIISKTAPQIVTTANAGCLMQLSSGMNRSLNKRQVFHFIEVIANLLP